MIFMLVCACACVYVCVCESREREVRIEPAGPTTNAISSTAVFQRGSCEIRVTSSPLFAILE
jgi:hypothetical protein